MDHHRRDLAFGDDLILPETRLGKKDARAVGANIARPDMQQIINFRRLAIIHFDPRQREGGRVFPLQQRLVGNPGIAQMVRPAALEETQIIGVVDHAGEIGVFIIDPHGDPVLARAVEIGLVQIWQRHGAKPPCLLPARTAQRLCLGFRPGLRFRIN